MLFWGEVCFNHENRTARMCDKFVGHLKETPRWNAMTVVMVERCTSKLIYASSALSILAVDFYFTFKITRRRLSQLNCGLTSDMDPMHLSFFSAVLFRRWFSRVVKNAPIVPSPVAKLSSVFVTDASLEE
jgi:hypothetical protein